MEASDVLLIENEPYHDYDVEATSPPVCTVERGINFNGLGEAGHEPFIFYEQQQGSVTTNRKPYDLTISCILLRAFALCPRNIKIISNGYWNEYTWENARELYRSLWPSECIHCPWDDETDYSGEDDFERELRKKHRILPPRKSSKNKNQGRAIRQSRLKMRTGMRSIRACPVSGVSMVRFDAIRGRISHCATSCEHQKCYPDLLQWRNFPGVRFRLIDIRQRCVVDAPDDLPFAVLSYVWGSVDQVKLTFANVRELSRPQGLDSVWGQIPTTVRDAMMVCERLGEAYLWVDALCILQDSARDRKIQILRMRSIYSAAKFTIVAVSAKDAHEGLLTQQTAAISPGYSSLEDFEALLAASAWSRRGWCYQEQVLSHRAILFTANGIFFQCQEALYDLEGVQLLKSEFPSTSVSPSQRVGGLLNIPYRESLEYFLSAVELYSKRNFTYANDKVSAFQGVFHRHEGLMDGKSSMFHYGLPTCAFDQTFCWQTAQHKPHLRNSNFPSWSWLGWDDGVIFDRNLIRTTRTSQILGGDLPPGLSSSEKPHPSYKLRKPMMTPSGHHEVFGFPTSLNRGLIIGHSLPMILVITSSAHLSISTCAEQTRRGNSLFAVFPTICSQSTAAPVSKLASSRRQPRATPDSTSNQASKQYDIHDHDDHEDCSAKTPLGYIWLDPNWREGWPELLVMKFIALSGQEVPGGSGKWQITKLMCLVELESNSMPEYERLQIMDCSLHENDWLKAGGFCDLLHIQ
ncbi:hypothetical protein CFIO01_13317 [Colletotrichum fioriniae PJ7]|uniref:Heterokaryon incompatibility domain-containing protein n=1 Tax=Colletotrichum fioriniae PJ7 TaxID=1445577 RepID=A0A010QD30_9PEZI|nr:hypothetical protein CFIO01_13317 [Colletotrichum fioriniae PJ7]